MSKQFDVNYYYHFSFFSRTKNLTHLDVSENSIEKLDISALQELRSVRCGRNHLTELTLCGRNLVSLIAGNNSEYRLSHMLYDIYIYTLVIKHLIYRQKELKNKKLN